MQYGLWEKEKNRVEKEGGRVGEKLSDAVGSSTLCCTVYLILHRVPYHAPCTLSFTIYPMLHHLPYAAPFALSCTICPMLDHLSVLHQLPYAGPSTLCRTIYPMLHHLPSAASFTLCWTFYPMLHRLLYTAPSSYTWPSTLYWTIYPMLNNLPLLNQSPYAVSMWTLFATACILPSWCSRMLCCCVVCTSIRWSFTGNCLVLLEENCYTTVDAFSFVTALHWFS